MSCALRNHGRLLWLALGLLAGMVIGGLWPHTPLHAVATDRYDGFAIATGPLDEDVEAVYFLDFLSGNLLATALNRSGKFNALFRGNVLRQLPMGTQKNPRYLMVTGLADLRRIGGTSLRPGRSVVYVAELTTGRLAAYAVPWTTGIASREQYVEQPLVPVAVIKLPTVPVRPE